MTRYKVVVLQRVVEYVELHVDADSRADAEARAKEYVKQGLAMMEFHSCEERWVDHVETLPEAV